MMVAVMVTDSNQAGKPVGAHIEQALFPDWWPSRQAELDALEFGKALGNGLGFE
ncbi:hypothetical protein [Mesorhizobium sp. B1-1-9]|uniref:hypothetical protein n=1 Tax=Mesorhizobium sp. B1-1-9 TaxID=2589975 RepID=UPI0015E36E5A|nr:hypothetical protein [Mesorhizobium sp. B1-1-9]